MEAPVERMNEGEFGYFKVSNRFDYIMFRGLGHQFESTPLVGTEMQHQAVVRKYMNDMHNPKTIAQLSQASAAVLVSCNDQFRKTVTDVSIDPVFMSIYQFLRAMRGQRGSASAPTVFVVAGASKSLRLQYTLAFRTNCSLLISRKEQGLAAPVVVHDRQLQHASIKVVDEHHFFHNVSLSLPCSLQY